MGLSSILKSVVRPLTNAAIRQVVGPQAVAKLNEVLSTGITSAFQQGTSQLQSSLGQIPLVGNPLAQFAGQVAPELHNVAQRYLQGNMENLMGQVTGMPTARPVYGANGEIVMPSMYDQQRLQQMMATLYPNSINFAQTGTVGSNFYSGSSGPVNMPVDGRTPSGGFPSYPQPPSDPTDLGQQKAYQDAMLKYNAAKNNLDNDFGMRNALQASHKNMMTQMIQNLGR